MRIASVDVVAPPFVPAGMLRTVAIDRHLARDGSAAVREPSLERRTGPESREHLADEQRGIDRIGSQGNGYLPNNGGKGNRCDVTGEDPSEQDSAATGLKSAAFVAEGPGTDDGRAVAGGVRATRPRYLATPRVQRGPQDQASDDNHDSRVCGTELYDISDGESGGESEAEAKYFPSSPIDSGSLGDAAGSGRRLGDVRAPLGTSLLSWAASAVFSVTGRASTLVSRVLARPQHPEQADSNKDNVNGVTAPSETEETPTSVGPCSKTFNSRRRKGMMRGVLHLAAVFLLEALVFTQIYADWSGSWMTRVYGTGRPDIWEISGNHCEVSLAAWRQGWLALQPFEITNSSSHHDPNQCQEVLELLEKWRPRLVAVGFPHSYWVNLCNITDYRNSDRQKLKRLRERHRPFLEMCNSIGLQQLENGDDFLLQQPLAATDRRERTLHLLEQRDDTFVALSHLCAFGLTHPNNAMPIQGPTWWLTSSPEIAVELNVTCTCHLGRVLHTPCIGGSAVRHAAKLPEAASVAIMRGFRCTTLRKAPSRLQRLARAIDARVRGLLLSAPGELVEMLQWCEAHRSFWERAESARPKRNGANKSTSTTKASQEIFVIVNEGAQIPEAGIEFDVPGEHVGRMTKSLLQSVRRLHINSGHPPNADLERVVRLAGGSKEACTAIKGLDCTICKKSANPKLPRPARLRHNIGQFNDTVLGDLCYVKDSNGTTHGFLVLLDEGTDFTVIKYMPSHRPDELYQALEGAWINWAGPPDLFVADGERGFSSDEFGTLLGRAGALYVPSAAYAPWQKGKVERRIQQVKGIIRKSVLHMGLDGTHDMTLAGLEAASAINSRPGPSGVSASMMLFGQRLKLYGELYADGEPVGHHPDGDDPSSVLARRFHIRTSVKQATERYHAKELLRKSVSARSRVLESVAVGDLVFFYRDVQSTAGQKRVARIGRWIGPGLVIGHQGGNVWISFGGRCYLVAVEHIRGLSPDEVYGTRPVVKEGLEALRQAAKAKDYIDLLQQRPTADDLRHSAEQPAANDHEVDEDLDDVQPAGVPAPATPVVELAREQEQAGSDVSDVEVPGEVGQERPITPPAPGTTPQDPPVTTAPPSVLGKRVSNETTDALRAEGNASSSHELPSPAIVQEQLDTSPVTWVPDGSSDNLKWKRQKQEESDGHVAMLAQRQNGVMTDKLRKKMLDREIPYKDIPQKDAELYNEAERKEWSSWSKTGCVRVVPPAESQRIRKCTDPRRIIRLRFVYRDKNSSLRTPQTSLPVSAKARLCAQASREPLAMAGLIKLDSPTVQRIGVMIFVQLVVNFGWVDWWYKGDISTAFLQGKERDVETRGRLYLEPPARPLEGVQAGSLLEVIKSVYGLPDAPRAWWEELTTYLIRDLGFQHCRMDVAFLVWYNDDGSVGIMLVLHVDDVQAACDGTRKTRQIIDKLYQKYPFGEWVKVAEQKEGVHYTGRIIQVIDPATVKIHQKDFIDGRMESLPLKKSSSRAEDDPCTPVEKAEFRSATGNLHWVTSQTRFDKAVETSRFQKRQNDPTWGDYKMLAKSVKQTKASSELGVIVKKIVNPCVAVWSDSSLYGSLGEPLEDSDLDGYDKHKIYSQAGALVGLVSRDDLEKTEEVDVSFLDWRSRSSRRVLHATFAAESSAALEAIGMGRYLRAYMCDILFGYADHFPVTDFSEDHLRIILYTDCRSLFDNLRKDGSVPDDKWVAISVAALRCALSAGAERNEDKSECKWVASQWQLADCLTKLGLDVVIQARIREGNTRLHELSANALKKSKPKRRKHKYDPVEADRNNPFAHAVHASWWGSPDCTRSSWERAESARPMAKQSRHARPTPSLSAPSSASSDTMFREGWSGMKSAYREQLREIDKKLDTLDRRDKAKLELQKLSRMSDAESDEEIQPDQSILGAWFYSGGKNKYEVTEECGKLFFKENDNSGQLVANDDWFEVELPIGKLRLQRSGDKLVSNFIALGDRSYGQDIVAKRVTRHEAKVLELTNIIRTCPDIAREDLLDMRGGIRSSIEGLGNLEEQKQARSLEVGQYPATSKRLVPDARTTDDLRKGHKPFRAFLKQASRQRAVRQRQKFLPASRKKRVDFDQRWHRTYDEELGEDDFIVTAKTEDGIEDDQPVETAIEVAPLSHRMKADFRQEVPRPPWRPNHIKCPKTGRLFEPNFGVPVQREWNPPKRQPGQKATHNKYEKYKTRQKRSRNICWQWKEQGECARGDKCKFWHEF